MLYLSFALSFTASRIPIIKQTEFKGFNDEVPGSSMFVSKAVLAVTSNILVFITTMGNVDFHTFGFTQSDKYFLLGTDIVIQGNITSADFASITNNNLAAMVTKLPISHVLSTFLEADNLKNKSNTNSGLGYDRILLVWKISEANQFIPLLSDIRKLLTHKANTIVLIFVNMTADKITEYLEAHAHIINLPLLSHVYILPPHEEVYEVYSVKNITVFQLCSDSNNVWDRNSKLSLSKLIDNHQRRSNLRGVPLIGVARPNKHFAEYDDNPPDSPNRKFTGGIIVLQYWHLRDALNFTEGALISESTREGPNGTLTGYAVPINNGQGDICVSRNEFLIFRLQGPDALAFLHPFTTSTIQAYFSQPSVTSLRDIYKSVYTIDLWICLALLWILLGGSYMILNSWDQLTTNHCFVAFSNATVWMFGAIAMQGSLDSIIRERLKVIKFTGALLGLFCVNLFSSNLVAQFSTEVNPLKEFGDLLAHKMFIYGDSFLPTAKFHIQAMQKSGILDTVSENIRIVDPGGKMEELMKGKSAIISTQDVLYSGLAKRNLSGPDICNIFHSIRFTEDSLKLAMFVKRGSPFRDILNSKTLRIIERGLRNRDFNQHNRKLGLKCGQKVSFQAKALNFTDIFSAFAILTGGFVVALGLACWESYKKRIVWRRKLKVVVVF